MTIDQAVELLELKPPVRARDVQLARRKLAKRWHPDRAAADQRHVHERQMKTINAAADLLDTRIAADGAVTALHVRVAADTFRRQQREAGERHYENYQQDPPGSRRAGTQAERSIVYRYVRSASYPEWGVGSIVDVRFTGEGDDVQQWARVNFADGSHVLPIDNLVFVDFRQRERDVERAERFLVAAREAAAQGNHELAAKRAVYARNADPNRPAILRLLAEQYHAARRLREAGRAVRDWIRTEPDNPNAHDLAEAIYLDMGARDLAADAARAAQEARRMLSRAA